jgi:glycosyltransferase involved in cell wall biosynthesis
VALFIGGDYAGWRSQPQFTAWRNASIRLWAALYGLAQRRASRGHLAFVNSPQLMSSVPHAVVKTVTFTSLSRTAIASLDAVSTEWPPATGKAEPVRLLYSGRIVRDKGLLEAVSCLEILQRRGYAATLDLVGWTNPSDPVLNDIRSLAERIGVADQVRVRGYVPAGDELMRVYAQANVFVIPTYWDSLPRSMLEAMAVGLPVVASAVGGISHYFRDLQTAMLVDPRSAEQIADAVETLIVDAQLRTKIAANGRAWSLEHTQEAECEAIVSEIRTHIASAKVGR